MDLLLIVLLATAGVLCDEAATEGEKALQCASGEFLFENSCWWAVKESYTWAEAEDVCKTHRMDLASIHSELEATFVYGLTAGCSCWIGLTDAASEGHWRWSDGTAVDYLNWAKGEPDGGSQDCVATSGSTGEWGDHSCGGNHHGGVVCRGQPL